jgi:hypothetical protein
MCPARNVSMPQPSNPFESDDEGQSARRSLQVRRLNAYERLYGELLLQA